MADGSMVRPGPRPDRLCGDDEERSSLPFCRPPIFRLIDGTPLYNREPATVANLPLIRRSRDLHALFNTPEALMVVDYADRVIAELEQAQ